MKGEGRTSTEGPSPLQCNPSRRQEGRTPTELRIVRTL